MSNVESNDSGPSNADSNQISGGLYSVSSVPILNPSVLNVSHLCFTISKFSFYGLLGATFLVPAIEAIFRIFSAQEISILPSYKSGPDATTAEIVFATYTTHLIFLLSTLVSAYIGYKLTIAAGASTENPIPPANYQLLAPLISRGNSEAIDLYVRLSSLSGFTGTFTKLGLTGLPLATIVLTLIFSALALLPVDPDLKKGFMDLAKLTLGAFIGSFVQRQVEQRKPNVLLDRPSGQSSPPRSSA